MSNVKKALTIFQGGHHWMIHVDFYMQKKEKFEVTQPDVDI